MTDTDVEQLRIQLERVRAGDTSIEQLRPELGAGDEDAPLLTPAEVAARLRCSVQTAKRIMGASHPVYVGRLVRWRRHELADFLARGGVTRVRGAR